MIKWLSFGLMNLSFLVLFCLWFFMGDGIPLSPILCSVSYLLWAWMSDTSDRTFERRLSKLSGARIIASPCPARREPMILLNLFYRDSSGWPVFVAPVFVLFLNFLSPEAAPWIAPMMVKVNTLAMLVGSFVLYNTTFLSTKVARSPLRLFHFPICVSE